MDFTYHYVHKDREKNLFYAIADDNSFALKSDEFKFIDIWNNRQVLLNRITPAISGYGSYSYTGPVVNVKEVTPNDWIPWFKVEPLKQDEYKITVYENSYEEKAGILHLRDRGYGPGTYTFEISRTINKVKKGYTVKYSIDNVPLNFLVG